MRRRWVLVAALLLTAWTMGLEFAHVLEWQPKSAYPGPLYVRLQEPLYRVLGFDRVTQRAVEHGLLSRADARRWLTDLASDQVFAAVTLFLVTALKPPLPAHR